MALITEKERKLLQQKYDLTKGLIRRQMANNRNDPIVKERLEACRAFLVDIHLVMHLPDHLPENEENRLFVLGEIGSLRVLENRLIRSIAPVPPPLNFRQRARRFFFRYILIWCR